MANDYFEIGDRVEVVRLPESYERPYLGERGFVTSVYTLDDGMPWPYYVTLDGGGVWGFGGDHLERVPQSEAHVVPEESTEKITVLDIPTYIVRGKPSGVDPETGEKVYRIGDKVNIFTATAGVGGIQGAVDAVNHPPHYNRFPVEVIEFTEQFDFNKGNVVKYVARAGHKDGVDELEDLNKAAWYLDRAIQKLKKERANG